jgi:hypothetical protein
MSTEVETRRGAADWAQGVRGCLTFGIPAAILLISPALGARYLVIVWPALLTLSAANSWGQSSRNIAQEYRAMAAAHRLMAKNAK